MKKNEIEYNAQARIYTKVIAELLSKRYMETIREEEGGTYGVSVNSSNSNMPNEQASIIIQFDCGPEKQSELRDLVKKEFKVIMDNVSQTDLEEIKKNFIKNREENSKKNGFWMYQLMDLFMDNERILSTEEFNTIITNIDVEKIKAFAKQLLTDSNSVEVVMNPSSN